MSVRRLSGAGTLLCLCALSGFLLPGKDLCRDQRRQRDGQDHAHTAGYAADHLQGYIGRAQQLPGGQPQRIQVQDQGKAAAQKRQDQGVGHGIPFPTTNTSKLMDPSDVIDDKY